MRAIEVLAVVIGAGCATSATSSGPAAPPANWDSQQMRCGGDDGSSCAQAVVIREEQEMAGSAYFGKFCSGARPSSGQAAMPGSGALLAPVRPGSPKPVKLLIPNASQTLSRMRSCRSVDLT